MSDHAYAVDKKGHSHKDLPPGFGGDDEGVDIELYSTEPYFED